MSPRALRVLVSQDVVPTLWVAHCLDGDLVAQGASFREALDWLPAVLDVAYGHAQVGAVVFDTAAPAGLISVFERVEQVGRSFTLVEATQRAEGKPVIFALRFPFVARATAPPDLSAIRGAHPLELVG